MLSKCVWEEKLSGRLVFACHSFLFSLHLSYEGGKRLVGYCLNRRVPFPHFNCYELLLGSKVQKLPRATLTRGWPGWMRHAPNRRCAGRWKGQLVGFITEGLDPKPSEVRCWHSLGPVGEAKEPWSWRAYRINDNSKQTDEAKCECGVFIQYFFLRTVSGGAKYCSSYFTYENIDSVRKGQAAKSHRALFSNTSLSLYPRLLLEKQQTCSREC